MPGAAARLAADEAGGAAGAAFKPNRVALAAAAKKAPARVAFRDNAEEVGKAEEHESSSHRTEGSARGTAAAAAGKGSQQRRGGHADNGDEDEDDGGMQEEEEGEEESSSSSARYSSAVKAGTLASSLQGSTASYPGGEALGMIADDSTIAGTAPISMRSIGSGRMGSIVATGSQSSSLGLTAVSALSRPKAPPLVRPVAMTRHGLRQFVQTGQGMRLYLQ